ncbi:hypothetical protein GLGR_0489 [Leminorella grimontii ATCC 33999 = DSM 5078]|nr:hypothetical protein GLGR_0489 [Leminorella grimontii ATCC 33999 = DSM 5078]
MFYFEITRFHFEMKAGFFILRNVTLVTGKKTNPKKAFIKNF